MTKLKTSSEINGRREDKPRVAEQRESWRETFDLCVRKTRRNIQRLSDAPRSAAWAVDGDYFAFPESFFDIGNWTSSFFTGMALLAWEATEDPFFLNETQRLAPAYLDKVFKHHRDTMHDLGFLYSLYSVALFKVTNELPHREVGLRAADLLADRFMPDAGCLRAWGRLDSTEFDNMAIIDSLMNLPLLHWASAQTGNRRYATMAMRHVDAVLKYFIRSDDSVFHAYRFDRATGAALGADNYGGCAIESQWARGTAWAIYGLALNYRHSRLPAHLDAARRLARRFVSNLDEQVVPVWDFRLPPGAAALRDASAASIAVCGLQEILSYGVEDRLLAEARDRLLSRLCSEEYLDSNVDCAGVQKFGQVGDGKPGGAQNAYTSWGDYFLMEALARELFGFQGYW